MSRLLAVVLVAVLMALVAAPAEAARPARPAPPAREADPDADAKAKMAESVNAFAVRFYDHVRGEKGNLFLSPYSISSALAMTWAGARGQTADEMAATLAFPADWRAEPDRIHAAFAALNTALNAEGKPYEMVVANAIWGQKGFGFKDTFIQVLETQYAAGLHQVDFIAETEPSRRTINGWVEKQTRDKIKDLIPQGVLTPATRLVLTNAIYFKGTWEFQFEKKRTKDEDFFAPAGTVKVPMMRQKKHYGYTDAGTHHLVEMPYKGRDLSMVLLVPKEKDGLAAVETWLAGEKAGEQLRRLGGHEVDLAMPRFTMTWQASLAKVLKAMGMPTAFDPGSADFSGMADVAPERLFIQEVVHKAFVDVNEEGTEAAAATGVVVGVTAMPAQPLVVRADRPFVFLIRERRSGAILFLGRVVEPKE